MIPTSKPTNSTPSITIFSYGSNMSNKELIKYSKKLTNTNPYQHFTILDTGYLPNHTFAYLPLKTKTNNPTLRTAKATILKSTYHKQKNNKVYGTIAQVSKELYRLILKKEGVYKNYYTLKTKTITSLISKEKYKAVVFVMTDYYIKKAIASETTTQNIQTTTQNIQTTPNMKHQKYDTPSHLPSKQYENRIVKSAEAYKFPKNYINTYLKTLK
jgi:hypothetical protein